MKAVQSMLDFDYACGRSTPSVAALVYPFTAMNSVSEVSAIACEDGYVLVGETPSSDWPSIRTCSKLKPCPGEDAWVATKDSSSSLVLFMIV
ncbi:unnamed protein product [Dibothriocephalus latus]|uniref:Sushi domain-containing protein n=1 Tax=Dibothriocephalus latus TaxID=60516 RepID=A0A3P7N5N4_DIBLA|nr:unnamed protein product [Dibothriocephalus latus]